MGIEGAVFVEVTPGLPGCKAPGSGAAFEYWDESGAAWSKVIRGPLAP